jgi:ribosomal-protein-alanine N-acetyltransferase
MKEKIQPVSSMKLETGRLILRKIRITDQKEIFALRTDEGVNRFIDRPRPRFKKDAKEFIRRVLNGTNKSESFYWAITLHGDSTLIGTVCLWNFTGDRKTAELGYELSEPYQGKGIMHEAVGKVIEFAFQTLGVSTIEAFTHRDNLKSHSLLDRNNFIWDKTRKDVDNENNHVLILKKSEKS